MSASPRQPRPNSPAEPPSDDAPAGDRQRLWAPWRMQYVGGGTAEPGCIFCNRLAASDDAESLILYRAETAFVIMNLFPYNTGHVMIVPNGHVASPTAADPATLTALAALLPPVLQALDRVLHPAGFNIGMNVGAVAGAGVAAHLHEHVVPRWVGDANFMPIVASTMVLPELIPVTYAKVRAELQREMAARSGKALPPVAAIVLSTDGSRILLRQRDGVLTVPRVAADEGTGAVWDVVTRALADFGVEVHLVNWAGSGLADGSGESSLLFTARVATAPDDLAWQTVPAAIETLPAESDRALVASAMSHYRFPVVAPPGSPPASG